MRARFVRTQGAPDRVYVRRGDGSETSWSFPTYGDAVPHDLVHLVVEEELGLRGGFWGRVDRGVDPARINAEANRRGGKDKYAGFGADLRELYLAEDLAALSWGISDQSDEERLRRLGESHDLPSNLTPGALARIRERLAALTIEWRSLVPKGTIELPFNV